MPKSFFGPASRCRSAWIFLISSCKGGLALTAGVMAGRQEDTTSGAMLADDMAGSRSGQDAVLADQELFDAVCRSDLCNQLDDLRVPVTAVAANDEKGACIMLVSYRGS
jgi:hypothetical protein